MSVPDVQLVEHVNSCNLCGGELEYYSEYPSIQWYDDNHLTLLECVECGLLHTDVRPREVDLIEAHKDLAYGRMLREIAECTDLGESYYSKIFERVKNLVIEYDLGVIKNLWIPNCEYTNSMKHIDNLFPKIHLFTNTINSYMLKLMRNSDVECYELPTWDMDRVIDFKLDMVLVEGLGKSYHFGDDLYTMLSVIRPDGLFIIRGKDFDSIEADPVGGDSVFFRFRDLIATLRMYCFELLMVGEDYMVFRNNIPVVEGA